MTFSITAVDREQRKLGVAIASVFPSVGAVCPWVSEQIAISTQSWDSGAEYGQSAIEVVKEDLPLDTAAEALISERDGGKGTQFHGVELDGGSYAYTGDRCVEWAGHVEAEDHTAAGNMLVGPEVVDSTSTAFREADGPFTEKLLTALEAGEDAGGDKRGDNLSAALLVHAPESKLYHNLRVDVPGDPIDGLWKAYESAKETENGLSPEEMESFWGGPVPESVLDYQIKY